MKIIEKVYAWKNALSKRSKTDYIIIHNADAVTCTADQIHQWHLNNGWAGFGYHFLVRKNGDIFRGRPIDTVGAQCENFNFVSVGICFEGKYHTTDKTMPEAQKRAGNDLVKYLKDCYPKAKVVKHNDLNATSCPGQNFPFDDIINGKGENKMGKFTDIQGHYAEKHIDKLEKCGIVNGFEDGTFRPDEPITRGDVAIMIANTLSYLGK